MKTYCNKQNLNDHEKLRNDPLLAVPAGKNNPTGNNRVRNHDKGKAMAGNG